MSKLQCHKLYRGLILATGLTLLSPISSAVDLTNPHANEPIGTVEQLYDGKLLPDIQANTFRNIDRLYPTAKVTHDPHNIKVLPNAEKMITDLQFNSNDQTYDLVDYININRVSGIIALKEGKVYFEDYQLGNTDKTRWMSMSVVKSITATLIGIAL